MLKKSDKAGRIGGSDLRGALIRFCLRRLQHSRSRLGTRTWFALVDLLHGIKYPDDNAANPQLCFMALRSRDRVPPEGPPLTEDEAYLKAFEYATGVGLEGTPVARYMERMTFGDYLAATGGAASDETLGWDVWVVALAGRIEYRGFGVEHLRSGQGPFDYVAVALDAVSGEIISTGFYADNSEYDDRLNRRPFPVE